MARSIARSLLAAGVALSTLAVSVTAASGGGHAVAIERLLRYGPSPAEVADVFRPQGRGGGRPAVLVVHGGGWRFGDKRKTADVSRALAVHGFVAVNVNYSLAGRGRPGYPRQLAELSSAVRWMRRHADRLGIDPARIGALGSSAGAHLAALLGVAGRGPLDAGDRLAAVVAWSGPFDLGRLRSTALAPAVQAFLGCVTAACPKLAGAASPAEEVSSDDPPMLIVNSAHELVPLEQARTMAGRLDSAGVPNRLWVLPGDRHATEYAATALGPSVAFLTRRLR